MARRPRLFIEGQPHHVILRGNNRTITFKTEADYLFFLLCLREASSKYVLAVHALVLMTNHVHLLVTPTSAECLPRAMQSVGRRYVPHFNRAHGRTGTLWEGRYRDTLINSAEQLLTCMCYLDWNPPRAGIVKRPEDYRWSSYRANALGEDCGIILTPHPVYLELGSTDEARQAAYRALCRRPPRQEDIDAIRHATNMAWVLGAKGSPRDGAK